MIRVSLQFEPRDLWVGLYWDFRRALDPLGMAHEALMIYICVLPLFPIVVRIGSPWAEP